MDELALLLIQRTLDALRYGNHLGARSDVILDALSRRMVARIPLSIPPERRRAIIAQIVRQWQTDTKASFNAVQAILERELPEVATLYRQAAGTDMGRQLSPGRSFALSDIQGLSIDQWVAQQRETLMHRAEARLRVGLNAGESAEVVGAGLRQQVAARARETSTLAKTAALQSSQAGYASGLKASGVDRYRWVAELDDATCPICRRLDGKVFRFDNPNAPKPPQHFLCRCHIEPIMAEVATVGGETRRIIEAAGLNLSDVQAAERELIAEGAAARGGSVPAQGWARNPGALAGQLRAQSFARQQEILGSRGARRFAVGLSLSQVAGRETGRLSLDELRNRIQ